MNKYKLKSNIAKKFDKRQNTSLISDTMRENQSYISKSAMSNNKKTMKTMLIPANKEKEKDKDSNSINNNTNNYNRRMLCFMLIA